MEIIFAGDKISECVKIRTEVFVAEQGVAPELEVDGFDAPRAPCDHYLIMDGGNAVGTFRCIFEGDAVHVGRLCVKKERRGEGFGRAALEFIEKEYASRGYAKITLGAQCAAIPFYEKCGFKTVSDVFLDAGIPHRTMEKMI